MRLRTPQIRSIPSRNFWNFWNRLNIYFFRARASWWNCQKSGNPGIFVQQIQGFGPKTVPIYRFFDKVEKVFLQPFFCFWSDESNFLYTTRKTNSLYAKYFIFLYFHFFQYFWMHFCVLHDFMSSKLTLRRFFDFGKNWHWDAFLNLGWLFEFGMICWIRNFFVDGWMFLFFWIWMILFF